MVIQLSFFSLNKNYYKKIILFLTKFSISVDNIFAYDKIKLYTTTRIKSVYIIIYNLK